MDARESRRGITGRGVGAGAGMMAAVLGLTGCALTVTASRTTAAPVGQSVSWGSCAGYDLSDDVAEGLECARVTVPQSYLDPEGDTFSLPVSRRPAEKEATGVLLLVSGGPGDRGLETPATVPGASQEVRDRFDIVSFDPRGVGASEPAIDCTPSEEGKTFAEDCLGRMAPDVLTAMGTWQSVDDIDTIRRAVGADELSIVAYSYGTKVASLYAEKYPDRVRALTNDGVVDLGESAADQLVTQRASYQETFDRYADACVQEPSCPLGTDPAQAEGRFHELLRAADEQNAADDSLPAGGDVVGVADEALLWKETWGTLTDSLAEIRQRQGEGSASSPSASSSARSQERPDSPKDDSLFALNVISCNDTANQSVDPAADARRLDQAATYLRYRTEGEELSGDVCESWPVRGQDWPHRPVRDERLPVIQYVAQRHDPTTPLRNAQNMAAATGGALLAREGDGHTLALTGADACVDAAVSRYLLDPSALTADARDACAVD